MNLRGFLRQTVTIERRGAANRYGEVTFSAPEQHPARKEIRQNLIRNSQGTEVLASTKVMLITEVQVGDRIDGEEVKDRENLVDIGGKVLGWTAFL